MVDVVVDVVDAVVVVSVGGAIVVVVSVEAPVQHSSLEMSQHWLLRT